MIVILFLLQAYEGELSRLRVENKTVKDQLQRALKELRAYQVKYPSPYVPTPTGDDEGNLWTISPEAVNPLMEAYDTSMLLVVCICICFTYNYFVRCRNFGVRRYSETTNPQDREFQRASKSYHFYC